MEENRRDAGLLRIVGNWGFAASTINASIGAGIMSPEQASAKPLDLRTDIFSMGVMLYEMLHGAHPFRGRSPAETMNAIIRDPAPPLTNQAPELNEIIDKALAKDPRDRYQHAGDLGLDLRRLQKSWDSKLLPSIASCNSSCRGAKEVDSDRRSRLTRIACRGRDNVGSRASRQCVDQSA